MSSRASAAPSFRVMTYNVYRYVGWGGVTSPARVAWVIAAHLPDVDALQELDVGLARIGNVDQPRTVAAILEMDAYFHAAVRAGERTRRRRRPEPAADGTGSGGPLPAGPGRDGLERRGALWVRLGLRGRSAQLINTH